MTVAEEGEGVVTLADSKRYVLAPLTLAQIKRARALLPVLESGADDADDAAIEFVGLALKRRHPDLTAEQVADLIEFRALPELITKVLTLSGLGGAPGEATAGQS